MVQEQRQFGCRGGRTVPSRKAPLTVVVWPDRSMQGSDVFSSSKVRQTFSHSDSLMTPRRTAAFQACWRAAARASRSSVRAMVRDRDRAIFLPSRSSLAAAFSAVTSPAETAACMTS